MMRKRKGMMFRCRACGNEFCKPPTPTKAVVVTCPKCGSDDVEFMY